jgi:arylsulfatase A-like enzyme
MLAMAGFALLLLALSGLPGPVAAQAVSGNILVVVADDFGVDLASFYPATDRFATTPPAPPIPNLAALASRGVVFRRAWASPLCSPTRAGILTGRYGFRTGIGRAKPSTLPELQLSETTLPELFQAAAPAYYLAHLGKWHLSRSLDSPNRHGWTHYAGPPPAAGRINYFSWTKVVDGTAAPSTTYAPSDTVDDAVAAIAEAARQGRPYLAWVAFNAVHKPFHKPPNELHGRDSLVPRDATDRELFEAMVEALDTEIGRLLRAVDLQTTTVIFVGDNGTAGEAVAPPYSPVKDKGTVYHAGVHVPLVVAGQGVRRPGRLVKALVNTVDLFPTILELAGIDPAAALPPGVRTDGVSLAPYLRNEKHPSPRAWAFAELFTEAFDGDWERTIRNHQFVLIERYDGSREFYNLALDPLQNDDLLRRPLTTSEQRALATLDGQLDRLIASR